MAADVVACIQSYLLPVVPGFQGLKQVRVPKGGIFSSAEGKTGSQTTGMTIFTLSFPWIEQEGTTGFHIGNISGHNGHVMKDALRRNQAVNRR